MRVFHGSINEITVIRHSSSLVLALVSGAAVPDLSSWVQCSLEPFVASWLYVRRAERLFIPAYICIIIGSELCQLWVGALLQQLMKRQEHALMTHDALRAWEPCGLKAEILQGSFNWLWQQEMESATGPGGSASTSSESDHRCIMWVCVITETKLYIQIIHCKKAK